MQTALPIVLQHVRELALLHIADAERTRFSLLTPFPPDGPDFPDYDAASLTFADIPSDGATAATDTVRAYEFARRTDALFYDYSYGLRSEEYRLTDVCDRFYRTARFANDLSEGKVRFDEKAAAFVRYRRSTAGDLGRADFRYTAPSPIAWRNERTIIAGSELERLRAKAIAVYQDVQESLPEPSALLTALVEQLRRETLAEIGYEFGHFDVIREWLDLSLFDHRDWTFPDGTRRLYGDGDPDFDAGDVRLAYAQRFYVARAVSAVAAPQHVDPLPPPHIRDHAEAPQRGLVRRMLMSRQLTRAIAPTARPGFVWVPATGEIDGHWERARAAATATATAAAEPEPDSSPTPRSSTTFIVTAVRCRRLPGVG